MAEEASSTRPSEVLKVAFASFIGAGSKMKPLAAMRCKAPRRDRAAKSLDNSINRKLAMPELLRKDSS